MIKTQRSNNSTLRSILLIAFSLLCSLLLWVYVTDTEGKTITEPFPGVAVRLDGVDTMRESRGLIVTDISATSARVMLTGSRRTISALNAKDLSVSVDVSTITRTGYYSFAPDVNYPTRVDSNALSAEIVPETIRFYVDMLDKKTIPVEGAFNGSAEEGFVAEPLEFNPSTIIIYGPEQVLSQVRCAFVDVTRSDVDRTLTFDSTFVLLDNEGNPFESEEITFDTETVSVTLPISAVKEVSLAVDLVPGGGATDANVHWSVEPASITLTGPSEVLEGVNNITVARIELAQITEESFSETYRIVIPNDTEITSGAREAVVKLELAGLSKQTFSVEKSNISCINISEGYDWEILNDSLDDVVIRGPAEALSRVTGLNIRAVADLTEYGNVTGYVTVPVKISVDGNTEVGAIGEYKVYVNITRTGEETG